MGFAPSCSGTARTYIQSRDLKPLDRHFPELHDALAAALPEDCAVDGEIVIATPRGLDFDALQMRLHPAASRVAKLARETPASFVAFDVLAEGAATSGDFRRPSDAPGSRGCSTEPPRPCTSRR